MVGFLYIGSILSSVARIIGHAQAPIPWRRQTAPIWAAIPQSCWFSPIIFLPGLLSVVSSLLILVGHQSNSREYPTTSNTGPLIAMHSEAKPVNKHHSRCRRVILLLTLCVLCTNMHPALAQSGKDSVRAFLKDRFGFSNGEVTSMERGEIITKELPAENNVEVAVAGAMRIAIPFKLAVSSYEHLESFRKNPNIAEIGKFSVPPRMEDLDSLTMEEEDRKALKDCKSGDCKIKLPDSLMVQIHKEVDWDSPNYDSTLLSLTKRNYVNYVAACIAGGNGALMNYDDMEYPQSRADEYLGLIGETPNLSDWGKALYGYLDGSGGGSLPNSSTKFFWQKEIFSGAKPTTTISQVVIYTPNPDSQLALVASKQLYADHFFEAALMVTALVGSPGDTAGTYLVYLNRSNFDDLRKTGLFSFTGRVRHEIFKGVERDLIWVREMIKAAAPAEGK